MKLTKLILGIICAISVCSCSPKITTNITKSAPAYESKHPVAIYRSDSQLPQGAEELGTVQINNSNWFAARCNEAAVLSAAIDEAAKAGGDALLITETPMPNVWNNCYQMEAVIFKLPFRFSESEILRNENIYYSSDLLKGGQIAPRVTFAANVGYGWRTAKLASNIPANLKPFAKNLMNGFTWDASVAYFFNDNYGISMNFLNYRASYGEYGTLSGAPGTLKMIDNIYFIAPAFVARYPTKNQKWLFDVSSALGYIYYNHEEIFNKPLGKLYGGTLGFQTAVGVEYRISQVVGIGANAKLTSGVLKSVTSEENGQKQKRSMGDDGEGLGQLSLMLGVRFYIK